MKPKKPFPFDHNNWPIGILPDGTLNVVEKGTPSFKPVIVDDDPFLERDDIDLSDEEDEAQDRANGLLTNDD